MKNFIRITAIAIFIFSASTTQAQFLKKLKDRVVNAAEETVHRKAEDKAAQKTEEAMDDVLTNKERNQGENPANGSEMEEDMPSDEESQQAADFMSSIMGGKKAEVKDQYSFTSTAVMLVEDYSGKKVESNTMTQSYGDGVVMSTVPEAGGLYLIDFENEAAIIIDEKKATAQTMSLDWMKKMVGKKVKEEIEEMPSIEKTGKTKTINGYTCYEYIGKSEDTEAQIWFTPEVNFSYHDLMSDFSSMFGQQFGDNSFTENGYMMEATTFEKGKKVSFYQVQEYSTEKKTVDMSQYTVQGMF